MGSNEVGHVSSRVEPRVNPVPVVLRAFSIFGLPWRRQQKFDVYREVYDKATVG